MSYPCTRVFRAILFALILTLDVLECSYIFILIVSSWSLLLLLLSFEGYVKISSDGMCVCDLPISSCQVVGSNMVPRLLSSGLPLNRPKQCPVFSRSQVGPPVHCVWPSAYLVAFHTQFLNFWTRYLQPRGQTKGEFYPGSGPFVRLSHRLPLP